MSEDRPDTLYADPLLAQEAFTFDQKVVSVFPDMIKRSVPGYPAILNNIRSLASRYVRESSNCYDLGCSLGASTLAIEQGIAVKDVTIHAVDNSSAMIASCQKHLTSARLNHSKLERLNIKTIIREADVNTIDMQNASLCTLNFTLQFIKLEQRTTLLTSIYNALNSGGVLILSEKVSFEDANYNELMIELHHEFKRNNGYSELEISQKRDALERVLIPETIHTHKTRLSSIGFKPVDIWFQCFNFVSLIAIKP